MSIKFEKLSPYYQTLHGIKDEERQIWKIAYYSDGQILNIKKFYKPISKLINYEILSDKEKEKK